MNRPPQLTLKDINVIYAAQAKAATQIANDDVAIAAHKQIVLLSQNSEIFRGILQQIESMITIAADRGNNSVSIQFSRLFYASRAEEVVFILQLMRDLGYYCQMEGIGESTNWLNISWN